MNTVDNTITDTRYTYTHHGCLLQLKQSDEQKTHKQRNGNEFISTDTLSIEGRKLVFKSIVTATTAPAETNMKAIPEKNYHTLFTLSPNPASSYFTIFFQRPIISNTILKLTDIAGKTILSKELPGINTKKIDVSNLSSGLYIVTIISGNKIYTQKLFIQ